MTRLILASSSPRRQELIQLLDYPSQVVVSNVDENAITIADPALYVLETARQKATAVARLLASDTKPPYPYPGEKALLVAADTTVALDGEILGKPADADEARQMLQRLRDRKHVVHTGLVVKDLGGDKTEEGVHSATVTMRPYRDVEIEAYIATGDPLDKAGGYAIQHPLFSPVSHFQGCYLGIMGLSVCHLLQLLEGLGIPPRVDTAALLSAHQGTACPLLDLVSGKQ
jgi:MAF protein